ncbi:E3 ubiquitin-protein ligase HUWE1-like, partial [Tropilaelaps mercedesae]
MVPLLCLLLEKYASNAPPRTQRHHNYQSSESNAITGNASNTGDRSAGVPIGSIPSSCSGGGTVGPPRWLVSVILLLDLYEKAVLALNRRLPLVRGLNTNRRRWKWFDERSGRWMAYTPANNQTIDEAYVSGLPTVRFSASRRKYSADFTSMMQVNEDSTHWRPMMLTWDKWEYPSIQTCPTGITTSVSVASNESNTHEQTALNQAAQPATNQSRGAPSECNPDLPNEPLEGLRSGHKEVLIRSCVQLLASPVDADTLHALLRLTLRLTRNHAEATLFAETGGVRTLLALDTTACQPFSGFTSLVTLIVRHVMEDPKTLQVEMERVVQGAVSQHLPPLTLSGHAGLGSHGALSEMHYTLRVLGPATCRDPKLFTEVAKNQLRISLIPSGATTSSGQGNGSNKRGGSGSNNEAGGSTSSGGGNQQDMSADDDADVRLASPSAVQRLRVATSSSLASTAVGSKSTSQSNGSSTSLPPLSPVASQVVAELLETLVVGQETNITDGAQDGVVTNAAPLLPRSAVCRLLAELVASYPAVARLLVEHRYVGPPEPCSALSFIIDHLLPAQQLPTTTSSGQQIQQGSVNASSNGATSGASVPGDKDAAALSRVLITTLAGCSQPPEVQQCLLHELRSGIQRALALPECPEKHARIQALTGLIGCVARAASQQSGSGRNSSSAGGPPGSACSAPSRLVALLIKRGLLSDLARVAHSLDLSSPHLAATVNSALRPLEMLTSSSHLAGAAPFRKGKNQGPQQHHGRSFADVVTGRSRGDLGADEADEVAAGDDDDAEMDDTVLHRSAEEGGVGTGSVGGDGIPTLDNIMEMILENDMNGTFDAVLNRTIELEQHLAPLEHHVRLEMELDRPEGRGGLIELRQHQQSTRTPPEDEEMDDMELEEEDDDNATVDGADTTEHRERERRHRRGHHQVVAGEEEPVDDGEPDEDDSHMMADDSADTGDNHASSGGRNARLARTEHEDDVVVPVEEVDDEDDDSDSESNDGPDRSPDSDRGAISQVVPSDQQQGNISPAAAQVGGSAVSDAQGSQNGSTTGQENRTNTASGQGAEQDEDDEE